MSVTDDRVLVECAVCHIRFDASVRSARDYNAGRAEPRCLMHRKRKPRSSRTTLALYRRWWLDRFSVEEIVDMGTAVASVLPSSRSPQAMTASSQPPEQ